MNYWQTVRMGYSIDFKFKTLVDEYFHPIWIRISELVENIVLCVVNTIYLPIHIVVFPITWLLRPLLIWPFFYKSTIEKLYQEDLKKKQSKTQEEPKSEQRDKL
jgi:hypothetical protein